MNKVTDNKTINKETSYLSGETSGMDLRPSI